MAGIPEGGFEKPEQLEKWLNGLPMENARKAAIAIAGRSSLRASVFLGRQISGRTLINKSLTLAIFRANAISRAALEVSAFEIEYAARAATRAAARASADAAGAATYAAARAADAAGDATYAAARAADAAVAATYAADATNAAAFWDAVTADARIIERTQNPADLLNLPLWPDGAPQVWTDAKSDFAPFLTQLDAVTRDGWTVWRDWYDSIAAGKNSFFLPINLADALDRRIALGDGRYDFWEREPGEINREIAGWVEEAKREAQSTLPVFISYNEADKNAAIDIGDVIENAGYRVFAQYKDMPPGSNFIAKMQVGLSIMGKFAPVYSPQYIASDICLDEWNAAYNMDRGGKRRLIVGYLVKPTELPPLQKQICYVPLYGLTKPEAKKAILDALLSDGQLADANESRRKAAALASPAPTINANGKVDIDPEAEAEQQFVDDELAKLPDSLRKLIGQILESAADRNLPSIIKSPLQDYRTELNANGAAPRIADLQRSIEIVKAEYDDAIEYGDGWLRGGLKKALEQLFPLHEKLRQRFPLFMLRDFELARSPIDHQNFDLIDFSRAHKSYTESVRKAAADGLATDEFLRIAEWRERQRKDIESMRERQSPVDDMFLTDGDRLTPAAAKKRFLFDISGTSDRLLDKVEKVTSIADSSAGKILLEAARRLLDTIW